MISFVRINETVLGFGIFYNIFLIFLYFRKSKFLKRAISVGIALFVFIFLIVGFFQTYLTYQSWQKNPVLKNTLPPVTEKAKTFGIDPFYFYKYCYFHYFRGLFFTLIISLFVFILFYFLKKKEFVDETDSLFAVFGTILSGIPGFIVFLTFTFLIGLSFEIFQNFIKKKKKRIFLTLPLLISLLITQIFSKIIISHTFLTNLVL